MKTMRWRITNTNFSLIAQFQSTYRAVISSFYNVSADFFYCNRFLRMWLSSKVYSCVPLYNRTGRVDPQGNRVGFFTFPKYPNIRKQWLQKIRRDVGPNVSLTKDTKICSLHFRGEEIKTGISSKKWNQLRAQFVRGLRGVLLHGKDIRH